MRRGTLAAWSTIYEKTFPHNSRCLLTTSNSVVNPTTRVEFAKEKPAQEISATCRILVNLLAIPEGLPSARKTSCSAGPSRARTNRWSSSIERVEKKELGLSMFVGVAEEEGNRR